MPRLLRSTGFCWSKVPCGPERLCQRSYVLDVLIFPNPVPTQSPFLMPVDLKAGNMGSSKQKWTRGQRGSGFCSPAFSSDSPVGFNKKSGSRRKVQRPPSPRPLPAIFAGWYRYLLTSAAGDSCSSRTTPDADIKLCACSRGVVQRGALVVQALGQLEPMGGTQAALLLPFRGYIWLP